MSADALVMCRATRRWCVGSVSANASADMLADALVGSDSLPLPVRQCIFKLKLKLNLHIIVFEASTFPEL